MWLKSLLLVTLTLEINARTLRLKGSVNFMSPRSWSPEQVPCINDRLIFPSELDGEVILPENGNLFVRELVLPINGIVLLSSKLLQLTVEPKELMHCPGEDLQYVHVNNRKWMATDSWIIEDKLEGGITAVPHYDRIPCMDDKVVIPKIDYVLQLPMTLQMVKGIEYNNKLLTSHDWFETVKNLEEDNFRLWDGGDPLSVRISGEQDKCFDKNDGVCYCHKDEMPLELCLNVHCLPVACLNPIHPINHCCPICGGMLLYEIMDDQSHTRGWDKDIEQKIKTAISSYHIEGISWYFGAVKENNKKYLQLVIAEVNIYDSRSVKLISYVHDQLGYENYLETKVSGLPWLGSDTAVGGLEAIIMLAIIVVFLIALIIFYYPPKFISGYSPFGFNDFARFDNRSREGSLILSISHLSLDKAFDNPMYTVKEKKQQAESEKETHLNDSDTVEEEDLNSSDEEDDSLNKIY